MSATLLYKHVHHAYRHTVLQTSLLSCGALQQLRVCLHVYSICAVCMHCKFIYLGKHHTYGNQLCLPSQVLYRCCRSKDHMPALSKLDSLPAHELALRLFYLYDHFQRAPVTDDFPDGKEVLLVLVHALIKHYFHCLCSHASHPWQQHASHLHVTTSYQQIAAHASTTSDCRRKFHHTHAFALLLTAMHLLSTPLYAVDTTRSLEGGKYCHFAVFQLQYLCMIQLLSCCFGLSTCKYTSSPCR